MGANVTKFPTEGRPLKMDPSLIEAIEQQLEPYSGAKLKRAQAAVKKVNRSGFTGTFSKLVQEYGNKIREAATT